MTFLSGCVFDTSMIIMMIVFFYFRFPSKRLKVQQQFWSFIGLWCYKKAQSIWWKSTLCPHCHLSWLEQSCLVIGHRGNGNSYSEVLSRSPSRKFENFIQPACSHLRENTLASVLHAFGQGVHMVEVDVQVRHPGYFMFLKVKLGKFGIYSYTGGSFVWLIKNDSQAPGRGVLRFEEKNCKIVPCSKTGTYHGHNCHFLYS